MEVDWGLDLPLKWGKGGSTGKFYTGITYSFNITSNDGALRRL